MRHSANISNRKAGNILFLILLAVVLFAALSYAVTQSMRGGGKDASSEKVDSQAADLLNYFAQIDTAVQRMMLTNNVKDYQLDFTNPSSTGLDSWSINHNGYTNPNCTTNACKVFHINGGGVSARQFPEIIKTADPYYYMPSMTYQSVNGAGTEKADLVLHLGPVKNNVCRAINKQIGYSDIITSLIYATLTSTVLMHRSNSSWTMGYFPDTTGSMTGVPFDVGNKGTFCGCGLSTIAACEASTNIQIYHVVVAR